MTPSHSTYAVIMAGGIGSRFWPMSRETQPKQFLDILGTGKSLIQMTFDRLNRLVPVENILVVTQERYRTLVGEHLTHIPAENILCEPFMRNTAPCIAYANHWVAAKAGDAASEANIIVAPADHLILDETGFLDIVKLGIHHTSTTQNLVTLGIRPSRPDTGYGYIQFEDAANSMDDKIRSVKTFTEKPQLDLAEQFLVSGDFYWNSGIFIWSLENINRAFEKHLPEMQELFVEHSAAFNTPDEKTAIASIYGDCENISIDYGLMEKAPNVSVVLSDFGWSDLGTWGSLHEKLNLDTDGNGTSGVELLAVDSKDNVVVSNARGAGQKKLIALRGLENFIVVDTEDALLVCPKSEEQWIKQLVTSMKTKKG
ncbi:MAG TPA: mannose-1-phosphate guanylyltransferase [Flavobacteriales bacterium]|nr:mannose-1-phosphate guanylyltransferase [Flavobacteriales bacterium]